MITVCRSEDPQQQTLEHIRDWETRLSDVFGGHRHVSGKDGRREVCRHPRAVHVCQYTSTVRGNGVG